MSSYKFVKSLVTMEQKVMVTKKMSIYSTELLIDNILKRALDLFWTQLYDLKYCYIRGAYDKFPDFFRMGPLIDNTHMKL